MDAEKAPTSRKYYKAMLNRLKGYITSDEIQVACIDRNFVNGFRDYLVVQGVKESSLRQMMKFFRSVLRPFFDNKDTFKEAFADIDTVTPSHTGLIDVNDIRRISSYNLTAIPLLAKARDVFMLSFYSGGENLQSMAEEIQRISENGIPHQRLLLANKDLPTFITSLTNSDYARMLDALGERIGLRHKLLPDSPSHAYEACAKIKRLSGIKEEEMQEAVANTVTDLTPHWFAVRCFDGLPDDASFYMKEKGIIRDIDFFESFTVPPQKLGKTAKGINLLSNMLFIRCSGDIALNIRTTLRKDFYVYGQASKPAPISAKEMLDFMLLCRVSDSVIAEYFPDYALPLPADYIGRKARIICGDLQGHLCKVIRKSKNNYSVSVSISLLGNNMRLTGDVPYEFLKFESD